MPHTTPAPAWLQVACPELAGAATGAAVRQARALANLTRDQAAAWLSCSPVHLARIERGRAPARPVHVHTLLLVAGFVVAPGFVGWRFHNGELYSPDEPRRGWGPHHLFAARWAFAQLRHARERERVSAAGACAASSTPSRLARP